MKYGFVKVAAATPHIRVADTQFNTQQIVEQISLAVKEGAELVVFPELCVCGYTCGDLFGQDVLLNGCVAALKTIAQSTKDSNILVFVGVPYKTDGVLYNCAAVVNGGKVLALIPKRHLPNYAEFYEKRNFQPYKGENRTVVFDGEEIPFGNKIVLRSEKDADFTVAAELCEDLWVPAPPSVSHALMGANIIVNLSASDETAGKAEYRRLIVGTQSGKTVSGYVYADAGEGESTTDMVFSGHNMICENGTLLAECRPFEDKGILYAEIDVHKLAFERRRINTFYDTSSLSGYAFVPFRAEGNWEKLTRIPARLPFVPQGEQALGERAELILSIQAAGLKKRLEHTCAQSAVLGISGGLDSALALLVTVRAFDALKKERKDILAVTMPCFGTTKKTKDNALRLMHELGVTCRTVPIGDAVLQHFKDIGHDEKVRNAAYENAQARMRTMVLMDLANDHNGLVIGTGDLSELALGWATYNGDHMSMYAVNGSVPKTLVKFLIGYEAKRLGGEAGSALTDILNTEISPELLPPENGKIAQKTEELVGPYELHDYYLYYAVRWGFSPAKVFYLAKQTFAGVYEESVLKKWLVNFYKRFFSHQFKRSCLPDGAKVGSVSLSPRGDWRMPSDASVRLWMDELEKL
ncbi:MAG TPA: NAD(+) synthase [Candidatus Borkfalkia faecipullorum]|uniref:Glutamine-dependent NAD(+) synthetase n=1 Tax=Candidatus Borkfalkia faecipullorum TaxID=2838510 RepID=A0A9D2AEP8_9FIRM|nr:NAD(+) synthase [Candidatus Borkfalkia faecipullorum]